MINFFTKQEKNVILFLLFGLFIGGGIKIYNVAIRSQKQTVELDNKKHKELEKRIKKKAQLIDSLQNRHLNAESRNSNQVVGNDVIQKIDINSAGMKELKLLPNIGPVIAQRIMSYRESHGNFTTVEQLMNVKGIGPKTLEKIRSMIIIK